MKNSDIQLDFNTSDGIEAGKLFYLPRPVSGSYYPVSGTLSSSPSSDAMTDSDSIILTKLINGHNELVAALIKAGILRKN